MNLQDKVRKFLLENPGMTRKDVQKKFSVDAVYAERLVQRSKSRRVRETIDGRRKERLVPYTAEDDAQFIKSITASGETVRINLPRSLTSNLTIPMLQPHEPGTPEEKKPTTVVEDKQRFDNSYWKAQYDQLQRKYNQAVEVSCVEDRLVDTAREVLKTPYTPEPPVVYRTPAGQKHTPQTAVLLLSDAHIGKVVDPEQTLNFGRYDFPIFCSRLKHLENRVISIMTEHQKSKISKLLIAMLGDMVDGSLNHGAEAGQANTVFTQAYNGAHVVAQFLRNIAPHVPSIQIETVVGNHGRWGNQKKMPTKNRYSNLDMFFYAMVESLIRDIKTIKFNLNVQPFQTVMVEESVLWLGHGDHLKGGDKALGVPAHSIGRQLSTVAQMHSREGRQVPNIYCVGDKHKSMELPHCNGDFIINSSFVGYDEYAHASNFPDSGPAQKLFFVHPRYGRTATYNIYLQGASDLVDAYTIPAGFPIK